MYILFFCLSLFLSALSSPIQAPLNATTTSINNPPFGIGWVDPRINGGRQLDFVSKRHGEPLNLIISGLSDPYILTHSGFIAYIKSIGYSSECLGLHYGFIHTANLGDGSGRKDEEFLGRQYLFTGIFDLIEELEGVLKGLLGWKEFGGGWGTPGWGTCWESLAGGHHFRAWKQNGTVANSGAWFLGISKEYDSSKNHMIVPNGYDIGRDYFIEQATTGSYWKGMWWKADLEWHTGLLKPGSEGVNHGIAQDGRVAILTVNRL